MSILELLRVGAAMWHTVPSSLTKDRTHAPALGALSLNHLDHQEKVPHLGDLRMKFYLLNYKSF